MPAIPAIGMTGMHPTKAKLVRKNYDVGHADQVTSA